MPAKAQTSEKLSALNTNPNGIAQAHAVCTSSTVSAVRN